ncbi:xanthine dehydrogenase family protein molybdopterin-binding subunit [Gellertiella hungarica]|uniref:Isoquinoline 1-oxidoreductase beta subunit n=1 Tax=Gellertiella hungarica TaxID=1572859 RepID=A0A7W6J5V6_9HYPH|nr:molybdopterin cofactor-binding domain-containing protein [Gellertiella hungarica]MBB4065337.1 isoquinoline 1-oxidoreductase beta subunit [Gellertiella hungarica]
MATLGKIARRTFLFGAAAIAGGVAFGYYKYSQPFENPLKKNLAPGEGTLNAYLKIAPDNRMTVIVPRAEMGQGVTTTLAALVAEELEVRLDQLTVEHGPAAPAYYNSAALVEGAPVPRFDQGLFADTLRGTMAVFSKLVALQFTGGSSSTIDAYEPMRRAGATAREMLKAAAAKRFGTQAANLKTAEGTITDTATGKTVTYGEIAAEAARLAPPEDIALKPRTAWTILGKPQPRTDMRAKVTGAPVYGVDVSLPGLLHATIRMAPLPGQRMTSFDPAEARKMRGVVKVVEIDSPFGHGFGVIADNTWRAFQAADAVSVAWSPPASIPDAKNVFATLAEAFETETPFSLRTLGDPVSAMAAAAPGTVYEAEYRVPHLAHAPMEPMNATAQYKDGLLTVWAPNQSPSVVQMIGSRIAGVSAQDVVVHTTMLGGGFGRRLEPDFSDYAIRLALAAEGKPVKVIWTREEDMGHGVYRPAALARYRAAVDKDGMPVAITGSLASQSVIAGMAGRIAPSIPIAGPDNTMLDGAYNQPYAFANHRIEARKVDLPVPVGSWRSVGYSFNAFMQESFLDEVAEKGGLDPLELRRRLLADNPAALGVINRAAEMAGWGQPLAEGRARGLAYNLSFGTHVAEIVEVSGDAANGIRVEKVWCAADPGIVLDPGIFKAQLMSGILFGLSAAMFQEVTWGPDGVEQLNFGDYPALRINQSPQVEIALLEQSPFMGGAGEPGTPPSMPALANAVARLTGQRLRELPLSKAVAFA